MNNKTLRLVIIALMATLSYVAFTFLQIKIPTPGGFTSFHLGNTFCILGALLVGGIPGGIAGAIGMGIGDVLDPVYVTVAPKTIILKFGIGCITGFVAHKIFKLEEKENKKDIVKIVIISCMAGMLFNVVCEPIFSYLYTSYILGAPEKAAMTLAGWNAITTATNALLSVICASTLYLAIYPRLKDSGLLEKINK